jgi:hypothetical protein
VTRAVFYSAALNRNGPRLSGTRPALSGTRPALSKTRRAVSGTRPALSGTRPALSKTRPALSGTRPACAQEWYMYHLPGGAEQEKKEKGRTCDRSFAPKLPKLSETSPETLPETSKFFHNFPNLPEPSR